MDNITIKVADARKSTNDNNQKNGQATLTDDIKKKLRQKLKDNWLVCLLISALIVAGVGLSYFILVKEKTPFAGLIPGDSPLVAYIKPIELADILKNQKENNGSWPPFVWGWNLAAQIIADNDLDWLKNKWQNIFSNQMAIAIIKNPGSSIKWLWLADLKINEEEFNLQLEQVKKNLQKKYNLIDDSYRQTEITRIKHLNQNPDDIYYAQLKGYLIIANDTETVKKTIDKIME